MNVLGVDIPSRDMLAIVIVAFVTFWRGATNLPLLGWILGLGIYMLFVLALATVWSREGRLEALRKSGKGKNMEGSVP